MIMFEYTHLSQILSWWDRPRKNIKQIQNCNYAFYRSSTSTTEMLKRIHQRQVQATRPKHRILMKLKLDPLLETRRIQILLNLRWKHHLNRDWRKTFGWKGRRQHTCFLTMHCLKGPMIPHKGCHGMEGTTTTCRWPVTFWPMTLTKEASKSRLWDCTLSTRPSHYRPRQTITMRRYTICYYGNITCCQWPDQPSWWWTNTAEESCRQVFIPASCAEALDYEEATNFLWKCPIPPSCTMPTIRIISVCIGFRYRLSV